MHRLAATLVLLLVLAVPPGAGATPILRDAVVVDDDVIRLGDLFDNVPDKADVAVAPAPRMGRRGIYDAAWLLSVARAHDIPWKPQTRFDRVVVERASQTVGAAQIEAAVRTAVIGALAEKGRSTNVQVGLDNRNQRLHIAPGLRPDIQVRDLWIDSESDRFTARLAIPSGDRGDRPAVAAKVSGRVFEVTEVPVLRRPVARGEVVTEADIEWSEVRADLVKRDTVTEAKQILGMTPRRRAPAKMPLKSGDFGPPVVVEKGNIVTMVLETPTMVLTAQGRAAEDGAKGSVIKVMNTQSHKVVEAIVDGPFRVVVGVPAAAQ